MIASPGVSVRSDHPLRSSLTFVALAFAFSWLAWIPLIKLGSGEEYLNAGAAGPAIAALFLVKSGRHTSRRSPAAQWGSFAGFAIGCWILLSLYYGNRGADHLTFQFRPLLLVPAAFQRGFSAMQWPAMMACVNSRGGSRTGQPCGLSMLRWRFRRSS